MPEIVDLTMIERLGNSGRYHGKLEGWVCPHLHHTPQTAYRCAKRQITKRLASETERFEVERAAVKEEDR